MAQASLWRSSSAVRRCPSPVTPAPAAVPTEEKGTQTEGEDTPTEVKYQRARCLLKEMVDLDDVFAAAARHPDLLKKITRFMADDAR